MGSTDQVCLGVTPCKMRAQLAAGCLLLSLATGSRFYHLSTTTKEAVVELVAGGDSGVSGKLHIVQGFGHVHITGQIYGFKPDENEHSSPVSRSRHAGDLGNIFTLVYAPVTYVSMLDKIITLGDGGARDIAGKAIVVHAGEDDLGC